MLSLDLVQKLLHTGEFHVANGLDLGHLIELEISCLSGLANPLLLLLLNSPVSFFIFSLFLQELLLLKRRKFEQLHGLRILRWHVLLHDLTF